MTLSQKFYRVAISTFPFRSFTHIISKKIFHALVASYKPCINYIDSLIWLKNLAIILDSVLKKKYPDWLLIDLIWSTCQKDG